MSKTPFVKSEETDFILQVENTELFVSKDKLSKVSPVLACLVSDSYREGNEGTAELPEKKLEDVKAFLFWLYERQPNDPLRRVAFRSYNASPLERLTCTRHESIAGLAGLAQIGWRSGRYRFLLRFAKAYSSKSSTPIGRIIKAVFDANTRLYHLTMTDIQESLQNEIYEEVLKRTADAFVEREYCYKCTHEYCSEHERFEWLP